MQITKNYYCLVLPWPVAISLSATWGEENKEKGVGARYARSRYGRQEFWAPLPPSRPPYAMAPYHMCGHTFFDAQA